MFHKLFASLLLATSFNAISQTPSEFIEAARKGLAEQASAHAATWHFGEEEKWSADLDEGVIRFHFAGGTSATAPIQVVGTYSTVDGTFLWGWDHPSVPEPLRKHAILARNWGQQNNVSAFYNSEGQMF